MAGKREKWNPLKDIYPDHHISGEWYKPTKELLTFIDWLLR